MTTDKAIRDALGDADIVFTTLVDGDRDVILTYGDNNAGLIAFDLFAEVSAEYHSKPLTWAGKSGLLDRIRTTLEPFAACFEQIGEDDDEEWAKFRLLIKDYRRLRELYEDLTA